MGREDTDKSWRNARRYLLDPLTAPEPSQETGPGSSFLPKPEKDKDKERRKKKKNKKSDRDSEGHHRSRHRDSHSRSSSSSHRESKSSSHHRPHSHSHSHSRHRHRDDGPRESRSRKEAKDRKHRVEKDKDEKRETNKESAVPNKEPPTMTATATRPISAGFGLGRDEFASTSTSTSNNPFDSSRVPSITTTPSNRRSFDGRLSSSTNPFADFATEMDPNTVPRSSNTPLSHNPYHRGHSHSRSHSNPHSRSHSRDPSSRLSSSKNRDSLHPPTSSSYHRRRRGASVTDTIDALGASSPFGPFHVDGPYEATLRSRNLNPKYSPVEAVRNSNMEALRATPQEYIQDSLTKHVPLQGTAMIPPGERDMRGNVMDYEEGSDMMRDNCPGGGAYKRWDHVVYDPNDLKGKGEPSYSIEKAEKEAKLRAKREKQLQKLQQQPQHRPLPRRVSSSPGDRRTSAYEMGLMGSGDDSKEKDTAVYERAVPVGRDENYNSSSNPYHDFDYDNDNGEGAYALHGGERSGGGTRERISEGIKRKFGSLRRRHVGSGDHH